MRIGVIHNNGPGGAARATLEIARRLARRAHEVHVWTLLPEPVASEPSLARTAPAARYEPLLPLGGLSVAASPLAWWEARRLDRAYAALAEVVNGEGYDVVMTTGCRYVQQPRVHRRLRAPCVVLLCELHRFIHERPRDISLAKRLALAALGPWHAWLRREERLELAAAKSIVAISRETALVLERIHGLSSEVCHLGVDHERFVPLGIPRDGFVLYPAALHRRKRQPLLIEAVALMPQARRPRVVLVHPGAGAGHAQRLERLARDRGVALELREGISDSELLDLYNRAAVVAYPAEAEPFGLVPLEAMACETAVVGVAEGGLLETIEDGVTGRLVPSDPAAIARALGEVFEDTALARRLGTAGRARVVERWTWERNVDVFERALVEAASSPADRRLA